MLQQRPVMTASSPSGTAATENELSTENTILRQQLLVFQEDFDRERQDRAKAQSLKDEYKLKNENLKKRVRHLEQKYSNLERQVSWIFKTIFSSSDHLIGVFVKWKR